MNADVTIHHQEQLEANIKKKKYKASVLKGLEERQGRDGWSPGGVGSGGASTCSPRP